MPSFGYTDSVFFSFVGDDEFYATSIAFAVCLFSVGSVSLVTILFVFFGDFYASSFFDSAGFDVLSFAAAFALVASLALAFYFTEGVLPSSSFGTSGSCILICAR